MSDTDIRATFALQVKEIETYLITQFPNGVLREVDQASKNWLGFAVDLDQGSLHVAFSRNFTDAPLEEIRHRLGFLNVAGEMRRGGPDIIVLVRSTGLDQHPRTRPLPPT